ncbi:MAG: sodium:solute symporter [Planctomycetes bacterium]|nr:sodium:solute symporter [Planctomycetota bacterium]
MNLGLLDWAIVAGLLAVLTAAAARTRRFSKSVSGFLAANRCAGRYLISVAFNMAQLGVITLVWYFQQNYDVGYTSIWWGLLEGPAMIVIALTGWVVYRFRRTRALTLAQFFEMRYSKRFRVFAGVVAFISGIINYGIFPGVGARFFIALAGLPEHFQLFGLTLATLPLVMAVLLGIALLLVFLGGQIAVMVTDFLQGIFAHMVFLAVILFLLIAIPWEHVAETLLSAPAAGESMVHPFRLQGEENFNVWYWVISVVVLFYGMRAWQGDQGYNAAARNAHEAQMANILNGWRFRVLMLITIVLPICVRTLMHHPEYAAQAAVVNDALAPLPTDALRSELRTPYATAVLLPAGLLGLFCAAMLAASISTHDTYLHSWGAIFVQDVILPFRKKPLSPRAHLALLRASICGVAVFAFCFSAWYEPSQYIAMFLALTGAVFVGGAGSAIIGGLYWKRGTTAAAWSAMVLGLTTSGFGIIVKQDFVGEWLAACAPGSLLAPLARCALRIHENPWITGQVMTFIAIAVSIGAYVLVSLLGPRREFDLDKLLHRGRYEVEEDRVEQGTEHASWLKKLGFTNEFSGRDKWVTFVTLSWPLFWTAVFLAGTAYNVVASVSDQTWLAWWRGWTWFVLGTGAVVMVWFTIGGFSNLRDMFRRLEAHRDDVTDDGRIRRE